MGIGFGTDLSSLPQLDLLADEELPCEDADHDAMGDEGPGEWYIKAKCAKCDHGSEVMLVCENFKRDIDRDHPSVCPECDNRTGMRDVFKVLGKRK